MNPATQQPGGDPVAEITEKVSAFLRERPVASVAGTFAAGYIAGKLPIFRMAGGVLRIVVPLIPPALALFGAARVWNAVSPDASGRAPLRNKATTLLNNLLSHALSAREAYNGATQIFEGDALRVVEHLRAIHDDAARQLKLALRSAGAAYAPTIQFWAPFEAQDGNGKDLADTPAFSIMLHAEEGWKHELEEALDSHELGESHKALVRRYLLPRAEEGVNALLRHRSTTTAPALAEREFAALNR